ncbi:MarR family winged helix-turn-helix transcriptional regulator [Burkholderia territorii]|uniref:MarR family winged helix-turn-helix transcriptional regulator n=1 Tax=Burkholderia territorii TaxID=1503055 RepID=UPI0007B7C4D6|nr:MarR family transcriptional regulator [Burkholderia territorii]
MVKLTPAAIDTVSHSSDFPGDPAEKESHPLFDERQRTVAWMAATLHRLYDAEVQKMLRMEKISVAHWYYLRALAQDGTLNQLELSRRIGIASTTAVPALDSLERRGLVKRTRDPKDRRKYYVALTSDGRHLVDTMLPAVVKVIADSLKGIGRQEMRTVWRILHRIEHNLVAMANDDTSP